MGIFSKKRLSISGFRGFTKKLTGKRSRYQYKLGKLHKMNSKMKWGFRSYTDPDSAFSRCLIDNKGELCRFCTTKAGGDVDILGDSMTSSELMVEKELSLDDMINLSTNKDTSNLSFIGKTSGNIISTGDCSKLATTYGKYIISTGAYSTASICKGDIVITGYGSTAITGGGDYGKVLSTGKSSTLINTCEFGLLNSEGRMIDDFIEYIRGFNYRVSQVNKGEYIIRNSDSVWSRRLKEISGGFELSGSFIYGGLRVLYERIRFKGITDLNLIKGRVDNSIYILYNNERLIKFFDLISKIISNMEIETTITPGKEDSIYYFKVISEEKITIGIQLKVEPDYTISAGVRCDICNVGDIINWLEFIRQMPFPVDDDGFGGLTGGIYVYRYDKGTLKNFYSDINDYLVKKVIPVVNKFK